MHRDPRPQVGGIKYIACGPVLLRQRHKPSRASEQVAHHMSMMRHTIRPSLQQCSPSRCPLVYGVMTRPAPVDKRWFKDAQSRAAYCGSVPASRTSGCCACGAARHHEPHGSQDDEEPSCRTSGGASGPCRASRCRFAVITADTVDLIPTCGRPCKL
jgi:hypothetical protein